ncbi:hypothetical protein KCV01_g5923, partial [Aureobasidium melanogenum]
MKIGQTTTSPDAAPMQDMQRRLGTEARFDSTLRDLESAMWPGSRAGRQPTPRLPADRMASFQEQAVKPALAPAALSPMAIDEGFTSAPPLSNDPTRPGSTTTTPYARTAYAMIEETPERFVSTAMPSPAQSVEALEDMAEAAPQHAATRRQEAAEPMQARETVVTWIDGAAGASLVVRHDSNDSEHAVADALAQARRHGLSPRRVTVNGVTTEHPYHDEDTP